jgi:hypothetical protein
MHIHISIPLKEYAWDIKVDLVHVMRFLYLVTHLPSTHIKGY